MEPHKDTICFSCTDLLDPSQVCSSFGYNYAYRQQLMLSSISPEQFNKDKNFSTK